MKNMVYNNMTNKFMQSLILPAPYHVHNPRSTNHRTNHRLVS